MPLAAAAVFDFDRPGSNAARADDQLPRQADQIHRREFRAWRFVAIVVEDIDPYLLEAVVKRIRRRDAFWIACAQINESHAERRDALRPDDAGIVVVGLDQRTDEAR